MPITSYMTKAATQAEQETGSATNKYVSPGTQHHHAAAFKFWCRGDDGTTLDAAYNVASVTDTGTGDHTFNFTTSFSTGNYFACAMGGALTNLTSDSTVPATGSIRIVAQNLAAEATDAVRWFIGGAGDQ